MENKKPCEQCSENFNSSTRSWRSKYCSERCRNKFYRDAIKDTPLGIMRRYISSAKGRGIEFNLPLQMFEDNMDSDCYYCGDRLKKAAFDRKNSSIGYTIDNAVPCCWECNAMKRTTPELVFINRCKRIVEIHSMKNTKNYEEI